MPFFQTYPINKFLKIFILSLLLAGHYSPALFAQIYSFDNQAVQSIHYQKNPVFLNHLAGYDMQNFDVKYSRFEFKVDPRVRYLMGKVTHFFRIITPEQPEITFALSNYLIRVDSLVYHGKLVNYSHENDYLTFKTSQATDIIDSVTIYYQGTPQGDEGGPFFQSDSTLRLDSKNKVYSPIIYTLSEPFGAAGWWPCKPNLDDKTDSIDIFITHPSQYKAAANGLLISEVQNGDFTITHWKHRHPIEPYLIAMAVSNYSVYTFYHKLSDTDSVPIVNYINPVNLEYARQNLDIIHFFMNLYNRLLIPYPFGDEKYGHVQVNFRGGMEHQTMTFLGTLSFEIVAHELAHQWFGDYITCSSWNEIWLNEGFADYLGGLPYQTHENGLYWQAWLKYIQEYVTSLPNGSIYINQISSDSRIFDYRLTYCKGALILHTLRWEIGDSLFFKALQSYLNDKNLAKGYASSNDFLRHVTSTGVNGEWIEQYFQKWYYGEGFPKYTLYWSQSENLNVSVIIDQVTTDPSVDFFDLHLPVMFKGASRDTTFRFNHTFSGEVFSCNPGFIVNEVKLDPERWIITKGPVIKKISSVTENEINVAPNPATNSLCISFPAYETPDELNIFDLSGKCVYKFPLSQRQILVRIDITSLPDGIYIARTKNGSKRFVKLARPYR